MSVSSTPLKQTQTDTACFSVTADTHPGTFPRVLELFAKRGLTPFKCHASQSMMAEQEQVIDIQMAGMAPDLAGKVGASLRETWGVQSVLVSSKTSAY